MFISIIMGLLASFMAAPPSGAQALPGVNVKGLQAPEIAALTKLLSEGACPCNPKTSLHACIVDTSCPAATALANFGADQFREGLGVDEVNEKVVRKYINDFVRYRFDVSKSPRKGPKDASIVLVEFADFECPHCAEMSVIINKLVKRFPKRLAVVFKQFPLRDFGASKTAALAALAAQRQARFWQMHDLLFQNQGQLNEARYLKFATELGIDVERFKKDMGDVALLQQIEADRKEAMEANISGTPAIYVNGRMYNDEKSEEKLAKFITDIMKESKADSPK
ncbi:MAG: thioredoxin domain-containing protein [Myxococcota bacterium]|nr:thioredoxin domain-containing protein [Myxococcota bacterium]